MPDLMDRIYCSEQIHIPPTFPYIMKLYCKAAIRTQPYDLLKWSAAYFKALANGEEPPVKERIEYPLHDSPSGLTPGFIKILINQFGKDPSKTITAQAIFKKWSDICLDEYLLVKLIALLGANTTFSWVKFVGVCAGFISKTLTQTMILICELFTEEPEGGMASIPYDLFVDLYMFLAQMECGPITESEQAGLDAIMYEEDICEVADKIKRGIYAGEAEGEFMLGEDMERGEEEVLMEEQEPEEEKMVYDEVPAAYAAPTDEEKGAEPVIIKEDVAVEEEEGEGEVDEEEKGEEDEEFDVQGTKTESLFSQEELVYDKTSMEKADIKSKKSTESQKAESSGSVSIVYEKKPGEVEVIKLDDTKSDEKKPAKIIALEDLEDSIRAKIEEKLAEEESEIEEKDEEFDNLGNYILGAAARIPKFTEETIGFKIFRRFMRQEVPGIGPAIDSEQIEKVVDFMDSWSHKQNLMVMPRNIRHWMCPPLDKIPTPQP